MARKFTALPVTHMTAGTPFTHAQDIEHPEIPNILHLRNPAIDAMVDLSYIALPTVSPDKRMYDARLEMQKDEHHVHLSFVVNDDNELIGFLSLEKILCDKPFKVMEEKRITRKDILVSHVMRSIEKVCMLDIEDVRIAKIGDIVKTFDEHHQNYAMVLEHSENSSQPYIRGLFIAPFIQRRLDEAEIISDKPDQIETVAELNHYLLSDWS